MKTSIALLTTVLAATMSSSPARAEDITGKIMETMNSGGYTYMRLKTSAGDRWAAVTQTATSKTTVKKGATATVVNTMDMKDFESPTLKRKFAHIAFGLMGGADSQAAPAADTAKGAIRSGANPDGQAPKTGPGKTTKASLPDRRTIAEVYAQKKALAGKEVVISGRIVKLNSQILGRNWAHLQDGTGDVKDGSDDIMVILKDDAELSQIITARGKVVLDKDLDGMYQFPVALEDAVIVK